MAAPVLHADTVPVEVVHCEGGVTHWREVGDPIGGGIPMCGHNRQVTDGPGPRGITCMTCRDTHRRWVRSLRIWGEL